MGPLQDLQLLKLSQKFQEKNKKSHNITAENNQLLKWEISHWPNITKMGNQSMAKYY